MSEAELSPEEAAALRKTLFKAAETVDGGFDGDILDAAELVAHTIAETRDHEERLAELELLVEKPPEASQ
jgi:hypothetical protein